MLYKFIFVESDKYFFVQAPDSINHDIAIKVCCAGYEGEYAFSEKLNDSELQEGAESTRIEDFIVPNLFIDRDENYKLIPDNRHFQFVDRPFMDDMLFLWTKLNRNETTRLLDEIEENLDFLFENQTNEQYSSDEKFELSIAGMAINIKKEQNSAELDELTKKALEQYGKLSKPSEYIYAIAPRLGANGYIVVVTPVEFWNNFKCVANWKLFFPDDFFPNFVEKEQLDNCIYEIKTNMTEKEVKFKLESHGFVYDEKFQEKVMKESFIIKEDIGCGCEKKCEKCEKCEGEENNTYYPKDKKVSDFIFAVNEMEDVGLVVTINPLKYWKENGYVYDDPAPYGYFDDLFPDYICSSELMESVYETLENNEVLTKQNIISDMQTKGFVFIQEFQDFVDNHN